MTFLWCVVLFEIISAEPTHTHTQKRGKLTHKCGLKEDLSSLHVSSLKTNDHLTQNRENQLIEEKNKKQTPIQSRSLISK